MRVQVTISAQELKKRKFKAVNPYAIVSGAVDEQEVCRTETLKNDVNPVWPNTLFVDIEDDTPCRVKVSVFDDRVNRMDILLAEATFDLASVFASPGKTRVHEADGDGSITVNVEQSIRGDAKGTFDFQMRCLNVKNVESGPLGLGRSDPFYELSKKITDLDSGIVRWSIVYRSETIKDNLNPFWAQQPSTSLEELCYCNLEWPLRITIFDWEKDGDHKVIGHFDTNVKELQSSVSGHGNADRESAFVLVKEGRETQRGLAVILKADVHLVE